MTRQVIRYQTKPEATKRNTELIQNVFRELAAAAPGKVHYAVLQSGDTFTHVVAYENEGDNDALTALPAFKASKTAARIAASRRRISPTQRSWATTKCSWSKRPLRANGKHGRHLAVVFAHRDVEISCEFRDEIETPTVLGIGRRKRAFRRAFEAVAVVDDAQRRPLAFDQFDADGATGRPQGVGDKLTKNERRIVGFFGAGML
jgi:hypothetical protein